MKYKLKQLLSFVLVLAMCISVVPMTSVSVSAQQQPKDGTTTEINSLTRPDDINAITQDEGLAERNNNSNITQVVSYDHCTALLIQSTQPWDSDANIYVLDLLKNKGYLKSYETVSMSEASKKDFSKYSIVMLANDQATDSYIAYELIRANLERYIYNGGTVLFGACDNGWAAGQFQNSLPAGVTKFTDFSNNNYIADKEHQIVTGDLTGGTELTNDMLYDTYCSHTSFNEETLPKGSKVILRSQNTNAPTLVEYSYGNGHIVASGQTWEFGYIGRNPSGGKYSQNSYDDLVVYSLYLSGARFQGHDYNPTIHDFNYDENSPSEELAENCSLLSLLAYQECDKDNSGNWIQTDKSPSSKKWLGKELLSEGYEDLYSYNYDGAVPYTKLKKAKSKNAKEAENSILYTIGHRRVSINGDIQDQIVIIFRGTTDTQWYGNFDITGTSYNESIDYHWSFQQAVNEAMEELANYIQEIAHNGRLDISNLSVLVTGHSRGAAVSNLIAHELTDIRYDRTSGYANDTHIGKFSDYNIKSVYAYTFATPNVATKNKINSYEKYNNIFNYCFTDDFVPNLPLENWEWGKYGQTYWATATNLSKDKTFKKQVKDFLKGGLKGLAPFSEKYTNNIISAIIEGTNKKDILGFDKGGVYNYYYYKNQLHSYVNITLYNFIRKGLGGTMQDVLEGKALIIDGLTAKSPVLRKLSDNLVIGGALNPALNTNHQCGTYYKAMCYKFNAFKLNKPVDNEYPVENYALEDTSEYNKEQIAAIQTFLSTEVIDETDNSQITYADLLGWQLDDPSTWEGVTWENGSVVSINISYANEIETLKNLDLKKFLNLLEIDCSYNKLKELDFSDCPNIKIIRCEGNQLNSLNLSELNNLTEINCSFNNLTELILANCVNLETLDCSNNSLTGLSLENCTKLKNLSCDYNELDTTQGELAATIKKMEEDETSSVTYLPQNMISNASFSGNDVQCLLKIANFQNNNSILNWDLSVPASWKQVSWVMENGTYYLEGINFTGLGLAGTVNFTNCSHLNFVEISGNNFTDLSLDGCGALEKLLCKNNYMNENKLDTIVAQYNDLSYIVECQQAYSESDYSESDINALDSLVNDYGLTWEKALYDQNNALKWTKDANGIYTLTSIDLTNTGILGDIDLTKFVNLQSINAKYTKITSIILPDSISKINAGAFENCVDLSEISLPEGLKSIEENAFYKCELLKTMEIPEGVTKIGKKAFGDCQRLYLVNFKGDAPELGLDAFTGCADNLTLNISFDVSYIELDVGQKHVLSTKHFPSGSDILWESSKPSVAIVDEAGNITALSVGASLITASSKNGFSATCTVVVNGDDPFPDVPFPTNKPEHILYANGGNVKQADKTKINYKVKTYKTTLEASTITTTDKKGKTKIKNGKLIAGVTLSDSMPDISKGKFPADKNAKKIATASISKGTVKITAKSQPGEVYLWVMDTGDKKAYTREKVSVKPAPTKLQIFAQPDGTKDSKSVYKKDNIGLGTETKLYLYPTYKLNGTMQKTEDATYTISVDDKVKDYFTVSQSVYDPYSFSVKAVSLKNNKKTTGKITIKCNENGKKAVFSATAVNLVQKITLKSTSGLVLEAATGTAVLSIKKSDTAKVTENFEIVISKNNDALDTTDKPKVYAMGTEQGFDTAKMKEGKVKIISKPDKNQKKLSAKLDKDKKMLKVTAAKGVSAGTTGYYLIVYNTVEGKGYKVIKITAVE